MTLEQRSKLFRILGKIEGLSYGVADSGVADGFIEVVEDIEQILKEDEEKENA